MNMNKIKTRLLLPATLWAFLLVACTPEDDSTEYPTPIVPEKVDVRVSLQMPASSTPASTRAISVIDENYVEQIDVLAFKADGSKASGWAFAYSAEGRSIIDVTEDNPTKAKKQFSVTLIKATTEQTFVVLANARNELTALGYIGPGADKDELLARLVCSNADKWNANNDKGENDASKTFKPFPMWGEVKETLTDQVKEISGVSLVRGIARFDLLLSQDVIDDGNFVLNQVYVYNSKNQGRIVPDVANLKHSAKVQAATVPTGNINNTSPLVYTVPTTMRTAFERTIYLFEATGKAEDKASEATCIVVGGTYGADTKPTYYRLDFLKKEITDTYYRDLLRNHLYRMTILSVKGRGYNTPDEAFNSKSFNMIATVVEWDDGQAGNVIFDNQYYLSIQPEMVFNFRKEADATPVTVKTDVPAGFKITKITEADGTTANTGWLTTNKTTGTLYGAGELPTDVSIRVSENTTSALRTGHIFLEAGRLQAKLTVHQDIKPKRVATFNFIEYINVNGTGTNIPYNGGKITAKVNTNMAWGLQTNIGEELYMAEPALETPADYTLTATFPANTTWNTIGRKILITNNNKVVRETVFAQPGYSAKVSATAVTARIGGTSVVTVTGYHPLLHVRAITGNTILASGTVAAGATPTTVKTTGLVIPESFVLERDITIQCSIDGGVNWQDIRTFKQTGAIAARFARSNVVWDKANQRLTFAVTPADNATIPANSQGLFFKWGSLVAISPAGLPSSYIPDPLDQNPPDPQRVYTAEKYPSGHIVYSPTGIYTYDWESIPYVDSTDGVFGNASGAENDFIDYDGSGFCGSEGKGDICQYISSKGWVEGNWNWRMATANELHQLLNEEQYKPINEPPYTWDSYRFFAPNIESNHYGYAQPAFGVWFGAGTRLAANEQNPEYAMFVPASGYRTFYNKEVGGLPYYFGHALDVVSGSSMGGRNYAHIQYGSGAPMIVIVQGRHHARPVRCIRE
ncbi:hypothetical protein [Bacteroides sp. 519]|uniref:hypothetical protein n=1 Tax=Bacteroides sp. 519 TaxID=2302937 RepID=UPI0013D5F4F6|nr:hypothetical protein [Bacteroides sp. 519]NDV58279.1 hypothetical protein [Bacteroides sp. 519]